MTEKKGSLDSLVICGNDLGRQGQQLQPGEWLDKRQPSSQQELWAKQTAQKGSSLVSWAVKVTGEKCTFRTVTFYSYNLTVNRANDSGCASCLDCLTVMTYPEIELFSVNNLPGILETAKASNRN